MSELKLPDAVDHKAKLLAGAIWAVATRWSGRALGLVSTVILARVLQPQDYGVVAMAFLVVGLMDAFLNTGAGAALVRLGKDATIEQINSAWTLRGLQGCVMALALVLISPWAAVYFNEPRVTEVLLIVSIFQIVAGFSNIGMALAYRDLQFSIEFKQSIFTKLTSVSVTLLASWFYLDYRGLVAGIIAGLLIETVLSYYLHPYRPRWCTQCIGDIWAISKWLLITGTGNFLLQKTDQLMAGRVGSTEQYGLYTVGADIGLLPAGELGPSLTRPLFPILVAMREDWERTKAATLKTLSSVNSITMPLGFGLAAISEQATLILLGQQWRDATPFVAGFAIIGIVQYLAAPLSTLLNVAGHVRVQSRIVWIEFLAFVSMAFILIPDFHLLGLMWARIGGCLLHSGLMMLAARVHTGMSLRSITWSILRPLTGGLLMYGVLIFYHSNHIGQFLDLLINIIFGAIVYIGWLMLTWQLAKRPEGIESTAVVFIRNNFSGLFKIR